MHNDDKQIPAELLELLEKLSENIHETWSAKRLQEGWRYGPQRDDLKKEHPSLVPYKDLSESEKDYDRKTALTTIQTILGWGFRIEPPGGPAGHPGADLSKAPKRPGPDRGGRRN
jgi:hypothetical protein